MSSYKSSHDKIVRTFRRRERTSALKEYIDAIKSNGCKLCGYNKCREALEFHHVSADKKFEIGTMAKRNVSINKLKPELAKCVLVCANCHREIHAGRIEGYTVDVKDNIEEEPPLLRIINGRK